MDLSNVPPTSGWRQFTIIAFRLPINSHEEFSQQATNKNCCDALSTAYTVGAQSTVGVIKNAPSAVNFAEL
jgi:hypothetical protein